jgi:peptidoglycan hydrolase-like protein with peptidoglycan-binding domain
MWSDFSGRAYTPAETATRIASLTWTDWRPQGIILHNTASPTLAQWVESGPKHDERIRNPQAYYEGMGWHGGPHWFVSRDYINEFSNPLRRGTHSPSFNATHFGIEMVGDFDREEFNSGDGAKVRDNAVFLMALLCKKFGWSPASVIKLHKEDPRTDHDCPGKKVSKADVIARVQAKLAELRGAPPSPPSPTRQLGITATVFGGQGDKQPVAYSDVAPGWAERCGCALPYRFPDAKRDKVRGIVGSKSILMEIVDVGPWNWTDPYWKTGTRPRSESQRRSRQKADDGLIPTNDAGIDLTPAAARALGIDGLGKIDWEFVMAGDQAEALPILRRGSTGSEVRTLQELLDVTVDGDFGWQTKAAVEAFQKAHGLTADGVVGPKTWGVLIGEAAAGAASAPPVASHQTFSAGSPAREKLQ